MFGTTLQSQLQTVILLCSSSRGGSSITSEFLRQRDDILHLPAEINPLLHQCSLISLDEGDVLVEEHCTSQVSKQLWDHIAKEIGCYHRGKLDDTDWERFTQMLHKRLQWQWPLFNISLRLVREATKKSRDIVNYTYDWQDYFEDKNLFHCVFIDILRKEVNPHIDPRWYDISEATLQDFFDMDDLTAPLKHPSQIIEEPPFVLISPWKEPTIQDIQQKPLLIKTPSNAYRIPFFQKLFQKQQLKIIHLIRDAESSINGLMDGWRYERGFHSHIIDDFRLDEEPSIPPNIWKYDLPPNYHSYLKDVTLPEICAFQWYSTHDFILKHRHFAEAYHALWFQDVVEHNPISLQYLWEWIGVSPNVHLSPIQSMPLEMATCTPREFRWFEKRSAIKSVVQSEKIISMMHQLQHSTT